MKLDKTFSICLAIASLLVSAGAETLPHPSSATFAMGALVTVAGYEGGTELENLPVLVAIEENSPEGFSYSQLHSPEDGTDIAFVDMDGECLPFEIDTWNPEGKSLVWVRLPSVTRGTRFAMCWGGNTPGKTLCPANPWSGYVGVWHLGEADDGAVTVADSTENGLDGASQAVSLAVPGGAIGGARRIAQDKWHAAGIVVDTVSDPDKKTVADSLGQNFRASFWMRAKGEVFWSNLIARRKGDRGNSWAFQFHEKDNSLGTAKQMRVFSSTTDYYLTGSARALGAILSQDDGIWRKIDVVWKNVDENQSADIYLDGDFFETVSLTKPVVLENANIGIGCTTQDVYANADSASDNAKKGRRFNGEMDEVRLSAGIPDAGRIAAEYAAESAPETFLSFGSATPYDESMPDAAATVSGISFETASVALSIRGFGAGASAAAVSMSVAEDSPSGETVWTSSFTADETGTYKRTVEGISQGKDWILRIEVANDAAEPKTVSIEKSFSTPPAAPPEASAKYAGCTDGTLMVDVTVADIGADSGTATVSLEISATPDFAEVESFGEREISGAGGYVLSASRLAPGRRCYIRARVANDLGVECLAYTEYAGVVVPGSGSTSPVFVIANIAGHCSSASPLRIHVGDVLELPDPGEGGYYVPGNSDLATIDGRVLTALQPGVLGLKCTGGSGAASVAAILILPYPSGMGGVYIFDETAASAKSANWNDPSVWRRADGSPAGSWPHQEDDIAVVPLYSAVSGSGRNSFSFTLPAGETVLGGFYAGQYNGVASWTFNGNGSRFRFERSDGETPVAKFDFNDSSSTHQLYLKGGVDFSGAKMECTSASNGCHLEVYSGDKTSEGGAKTVFDKMDVSIARLCIANGQNETGKVEVTESNVFLSLPFKAAEQVGSFAYLAISNNAAFAVADTSGNWNEIAPRGNSRIVVGEGGSFSAAYVKIASGNNANATTNIFTVAGGRASVQRFNLLDGSYNEGVGDCLVEVRLEDGGVLEAGSIECGRGCKSKDPTKTGEVAVVADGGVVASAKNGELFQYFSQIECGPGGLTIDSDYDIVLSPAFVNIENTDGVLILKGSGKKTLTGAGTTVSRIVAEEGTVVFAEGFRATSVLQLTGSVSVDFAEPPDTVGFSKIVYGTETSPYLLEYDSESTIELAVPVEIANVDLFLKGEYTPGGTYGILKAVAGAVEGSAEAWAAPNYFSFAKAGSWSAVFDSAEDGGAVVFRVTCVPPAERIVWNGEEGAMEKSDAVALELGAHQTLSVEVGEGATLNLEASVSGGRIVKTGAGRLKLAGAAGTVRTGIFVSEGTLAIGDVSVFGVPSGGTAGIHMNGGRFLFEGDGSGEESVLPVAFNGEAPEESDIIDMRIESPLVITDANVKSGCIFKRGPARLVFAPPEGEKMVLSCSDGRIDVNKLPEGDALAGDVGLDGWTMPSGTGYCGFNVAEGEVRIAGGKGALVSITHSVAVGFPASGMRASPKLAVDGVEAEIASGSQLNISALAQVGMSELAKFARLEFTNGAVVKTDCIRTQRWPYISTFPTTLVERATWDIQSYILPYGSNSPYTEGAWILRDGASLFIRRGQFQCYGSGTHIIDIDGSVWAAGENLSPANMYVAVQGKARIGVRNGGVFAAQTVRLKRDAATVDMDIDGGTWITLPSAWQPLEFVRATNVTMRTASDGGFVFPVEEGVEVQATSPVTGPGGFAKTGAGTLVFKKAATWEFPADNDGKQPMWTGSVAMDDPVTVAFDGVLEARAGKIEIEKGACREGGEYRAETGAEIDFKGNGLGSGAAFSGTGRFVDFSAMSPVVKIPLSETLEPLSGAPVFEGASMSGSVKVDFAAADVVSGASVRVPVAVFADGTPDVSGWTAAGVPPRHFVYYRAENGVVYATVGKDGFKVMVR